MPITNQPSIAMPFLVSVVRFAKLSLYLYPSNPNPHQTMKNYYFFALFAFCIFEGCTTEPVIQFQDNLTKQICITHWDANKDGELSYREANMVVDIGNVFQETDIEFFQELQHFTSIREIHAEAFRGCEKLKHITLPNYVEKIERKAFYQCTSLQSIEIPLWVRIIEYEAFYGCTGMLIIKSKHLVEKDYELKVAPSKTWLYGAAFSSLYIGEVNRIGMYAFCDCARLKTITIEEGVSSIEQGAFSSCWGLECIIIPNGVTTIDGFSECTNLKQVTIPNTATKIDGAAFRNCASLCSITIPDSVEEIGLRAFWGCSKLEKVVVGSSVAYIGEGAFYNCSSLSDISLPIGYIWFNEDVFNGCTSLPIENDVRYADTYVVEAVNKNKTSYTIREGSKYVGYQAFKYCEKAKNISIPDSVTKIENEAFYGCSNLQQIVISKNITSISPDAFSYCTGELVINSKIVEEDRKLVERYTGFSYPRTYERSTNYWLDNSQFSKITIGNNVQKLGNYAFYGKGWKLKSVTIPESVLSIGVAALGDCEQLTSIYCKAEFPPMVDGLRVPSACKIYVPKTSVDAYKSAPSWRVYTIIGHNFI